MSSSGMMSSSSTELPGPSAKLPLLPPPCCGTLICKVTHDRCGLISAR